MQSRIRFWSSFTDVDNDNDRNIYLVNDFGENNEPNQILLINIQN